MADWGPGGGGRGGILTGGVVYDPNSYASAKPSGVLCDGTSDVPAVQAAVNAANAAGGGTVFFSNRGNGTYLLDHSAGRTVNLQGSGPTAYSIGFYSNIAFAQDPAVILKSPYEDLISTHQCCAFANLSPALDNTVFAGLRLFGGDVAQQAENLHFGIFYSGGNTDITIVDGEMWGFRGKPIIVNGYSDGSLINKRIRILDNHFHDASNGNAIGVGYGASDVLVEGNFLGAPLGSPPAAGEGIYFFGAGVYTNVQVVRNFSAWNNLSLSGATFNGCRFDDNSIVNQGNGACITVSSVTVNDVSVSRNRLVNQNANVGAAPYGIDVQSSVAVDQFDLLDNRIEVASGIAHAIQFAPSVSSAKVRINGNRSTTAGAGIAADSLDAGSEVCNNLAATIGISVIAPGVRLSENTATSTGAVPLSLTGDGATIAGNTAVSLSNVSGQALLISGSHNEIFGNYLAGTYQTGIQLSSASTYNRVSNNQVQGTGASVNEAVGGDYNVVESNFVTSTITLSGAHSIQRNNP